MGGICTKETNVEEEEEYRNNQRGTSKEIHVQSIRERERVVSRKKFYTRVNQSHNDSSSSDEEEDELPMPGSISGRKLVEYIVGMDLDSAGKGVGVYFMNRVRIISGKFTNMQASGINLSFYKKREQATRKKRDSITKDVVVNRTLNSLKLLARRKTDADGSILDYANELFPKHSVEAEIMGGETFVKVENTGYSQLFSAEDLLSEGVKKMKKDSEKFLRKRIKDTVAVVPTELRYFERENLSRVFGKVGLNIKRIIAGSTASALYHGFKNFKDDVNQRTFLVVDLGISCLNVTIVKFQFGIFEAVRSLCRRDLSGSSMVRKIVDLVIEQLCEDVSPKMDCERVRRTVINRCKPLMQDLCQSGQSSLDDNEWPRILSIKECVPGNGTMDDYQVELSRDMIRSALQPAYGEVVESTNLLVQKVLDTTEVIPNVEAIDSVLVVGEYSRYPPFKQSLEDYYDKKKIHQMEESSIAYGSSLLGANLQGSIKFILVENISFAIGLELSDGKFVKIVDRGVTVPTEKTIKFKMPSSEAGGVSLKFVEYNQEDTVTDSEDSFMDVFNFDGIPKNRDVTLDVTIRVNNRQTFEVFANCSTSKEKKKRLLMNEAKRVIYPFPQRT